jgi:3,4-dihydroxy 2-butanone 4-phosphate synthase/GTP cyclohydrolase II
MPMYPVLSYAPFVLATIPEAIDDLRRGRMVILTDDEDRENEGDLVLPAQFVTPEAVTFMLSVARGYMCLALTEADCDRLDLHPQAAVNTTARGTAFTVSIDLHPRHGGTTGVSARERARCIQMAIDPRYGPQDFVRPGHINPLRARDGGVLVRTGQTEGSVDLCRLAGLAPAAVIIEIMRDDGEMARLPDLLKLGAQHGLKVCSVAQLIQHRLERESLVRRIEPVAGTPVRTRRGAFNLLAYSSLVDALPHVALTAGDVGRLDGAGRPVESDEPLLVRMHRRSLLGDVFGVRARDTGPTSAEQLDLAMQRVQHEGRGAIVYLRQEGHVGDGGVASDSGLEALLQTPRRGGAQRGADTPDLAHPDGHAAGLPRQMRELGIGCQILRDLGARRLRLLTNHAQELPALEAFGLKIVERVPLG